MNSQQPEIEILVDSLSLCLPDCIPATNGLTTDQKQLLIESRRIVDNYYNPENRKYRIMLNAFISILKLIGEDNYKELSIILREFLESKICESCDGLNEDNSPKCETCKYLDWNIRDMRQYIELE